MTKDSEAIASTPTPIQRYSMRVQFDQEVLPLSDDECWSEPRMDAAGNWVRHSDHLAAMAAAVPRWIHCDNDRLPPECVDVLGYGFTGHAISPTVKQTRLVRGDRGQWWWIGFDRVTHWQPLPQPPKETT